MGVAKAGGQIDGWLFDCSAALVLLPGSGLWCRAAEELDNDFGFAIRLTGDGAAARGTAASGSSSDRNSDHLGLDSEQLGSLLIGTTFRVTTGFGIVILDLHFSGAEQGLSSDSSFSRSDSAIFDDSAVEDGREESIFSVLPV